MPISIMLNCLSNANVEKKGSKDEYEADVRKFSTHIPLTNQHYDLFILFKNNIINCLINNTIIIKGNYKYE